MQLKKIIIEQLHIVKETVANYEKFYPTFEKVMRSIFHETSNGGAVEIDHFIICFILNLQGIRHELEPLVSKRGLKKKFTSRITEILGLDEQEVNDILKHFIHSDNFKNSIKGLHISPYRVLWGQFKMKGDIPESLFEISGMDKKRLVDLFNFITSLGWYRDYHISFDNNSIKIPIRPLPKKTIFAHVAATGDILLTQWPNSKEFIKVNSPEQFKSIAIQLAKQL